MSEHTPMPWRQSAISYLKATIVAADDTDVAEVSDEANAAFIVKAVNAHDILVSALLMSRAVHQDLADNYEPSSTEHSMALTAINTINIALLKAKEPK